MRLWAADEATLASGIDIRDLAVEVIQSHGKASVVTDPCWAARANALRMMRLTSRRRASAGE
jgi:hypothetical protein